MRSRGFQIWYTQCTQLKWAQLNCTLSVLPVDNQWWYLCKASINNIFQNFFQNSFSDFLSPMNMFDPFSGASGFLGNPKITVIRMKPIVATGIIETPEQNSPTMSLVEEDDNDTLWYTENESSDLVVA